VEGWTRPALKNRLGCFLPDLTRWRGKRARASLPPPISDVPRRDASPLMPAAHFPETEKGWICSNIVLDLY